VLPSNPRPESINGMGMILFWLVLLLFILASIALLVFGTLPLIRRLNSN
jgi:hypothetical protein